MLLAPEVETEQLITIDEMLNARRALTPPDYETIRTIRNECRGAYSHHNLAITREENERWWQTHQSDVMAWIIESNTHPIGVASLRYDDQDRLWSFIAIRPRSRGYGRGTKVFKFIIDMAKEDVYGSVITTNSVLLGMIARMGGWSIVDYDPMHLSITIKHTYTHE